MAPSLRVLAKLQTPATGYTGLLLIFLTLFVGPGFQAAISDAVKHPTPNSVLSVLTLFAGALLAWVGQAPLPPPPPPDPPQKAA